MRKAQQGGLGGWGLALQSRDSEIGLMGMIEAEPEGA